MKEIQVVKYHPDQKEIWNQFVEKAKNATFLYNRDFMDYHSDRFEDFSLMVFENDELLAVLPGNKTGNEVHSHQGLSYGGLVLHKSAYFKKTAEIVKEILQFLEKNNIEKLHLKLLPKIYHSHPSDEMDYLLFLLNARLTRRDSASVIDYENPIKPSSIRVKAARKARNRNLKVKEEPFFEPFWNQVLIPTLQKIHQASPTHSLEEIKLLHANFPNNIRQFSVYDEDQIVAGTTLFVMPNVVNVQYISANEEGKKSAALDLLFEYVIDYFQSKKYFTFGISNEQHGRKVNNGLMFWKETFGARTIVHSFYEIETKNHSLLNTIYL